jgi:hypothetical protein
MQRMHMDVAARHYACTRCCCNNILATCTYCVKSRFEWLSDDSEGISISLIQKNRKKEPLSGQR